MSFLGNVLIEGIREKSQGSATTTKNREAYAWGPGESDVWTLGTQ